MSRHSSLRGSVAIVGIGDTEVGLLPGRGTIDLTIEAASRALCDAGIDKSAIDGLITSNSMVDPHMYHAELVAQTMGIFPRHCLTLAAGGAGSFAAVQHAAAAIATGLCDTVLISSADNLRTGLTREQAAAQQSSTADPQFEAPYGAPVPAFYAFIARAHMHEYGTTPEQLAAVAVTTRRHAALHPGAQKRAEITVQDVLSSPLIADPLHLLDCSLVSDGGAAVVLTRADRAKDFPRGGVYLLGAGEGHSHEHISQAPSLVASAARESGERAFAMAGLSPADVHFAELYDCFTPVVIVELEDLGFCAKGEGGPFVEAGHTALGGRLPTNTHGGLLSHSHSGHPGSMFALTEAVVQLRGDAGARQVAGAEIGLVHAQGGVLSSHCTLLLGRERA
ncbi:MAG: thiolase family protein [Deltaproteobacteria bacterium]|nr:thiolase family protein [Deltaproteobacteria bacterium]